jgi:predicted NUDIX family NTP pyrophosphohydrolase
MPRTSAGLLLYRRTASGIEVFLVHPGGPFWAKKDAGAWSIPKGEYLPGEDPLAAARREFAEETGIVLDGEAVDLGSVKQAGGKIVRAWAIEGDFDAGAIRSNTFALEWPPRSGRQQEFPEVDRAAWFDLETAQEKILKGQLDFIRRLGEILST